MSFESPDMAKDFPGLYRMPGMGTEGHFNEEEKPPRKKDILTRHRESRPERRGKGYRMFEEEDSEEELVAEDTTKSPSKMKKHSKPSFKFAKREKFYKPKEKDKDRDGQQHSREREKSVDKFEKGDGHKDGHKDGKKKEEKLRWRKRKLLGPGIGSNIQKAEQTSLGAPEEIKPIFGVPLAVAVERNKCHDGIQLPVIFRECVDYIEEIGLACEGIYRISGVKSKVTALKDQYNQHMHVYLHEHEPNIVASLLKLFLRELPEPVLTKELMPKFEEASTQKNVKQKVELFQQLIEQLPTPNKLLLSWMIVHMTHVISKEKQNKMSLQNVSIVLSPTMQISHRVLNVLFTYARILFKDSVIKKYVPPLKPVTSKWSLDLPESPTALEEELLKQESLLNQLHEDVMKRNDTDKEEQLWEVQRVVTQLKRKIKLMKKTQEVECARKREILAQKQETQQEKQKQKSREQEIIQEKQIKCSTQKETIKQKQIPQEEVKEPQQSDDAESNSQQADNVEDTVTKDRDVQKEKVKTEVSETVERTEEGDVDIDKSEQAIDVKHEDVNDEDGDSKPVQSSSEDSLPIVKEQKTEIPVVDDNDKEIISDDDLTPTENSEGFGEKIPDSKADSARSSNVDIHQEEPLAETPDTPQVEPPEHFPGKNDSVTEHDESINIDDESVIYPVLPEPVAFRKISSSSEEDDHREGSVSAEVHGEAELRSLDTSDEDFVPPPMSSDDEPDVDTLQQQYSELLLEEEELLAMGDELKQKIETEQSEIGRLHQEIAELKSIREDLYDSEAASSDSSEEFEDDDDLQEFLRELTLKNQHLESENQDLSSKIQQEQKICLNVKVQIRMIQQRQLESSGGKLLMDGISESNALIESLL